MRTFRSRVIQDAENSCFALTLTVKTLPSMRTCQRRGREITFFEPCCTCPPHFWSPFSLVGDG